MDMNQVTRTCLALFINNIWHLLTLYIHNVANKNFSPIQWNICDILKRCDLQWKILTQHQNQSHDINFSTTRASHTPRQLFNNDWLMRFDCSASLIWVLKESKLQAGIIHYLATWICTLRIALWWSIIAQWNLLPVIIIKTLSILLVRLDPMQ